MLSSYFIIHPCVLALSDMHLDQAYCNAHRLCNYNSFVIGVL